MAASKGAVRVSGVREVQGAMRKLDVQAQDLKAAHLRVASAIVPGIGPRTPRRTGALAASWSAGATKGRARIDELADLRRADRVRLAGARDRAGAHGPRHDRCIA